MGLKPTDLRTGVAVTCLAPLNDAAVPVPKVTFSLLMARAEAWYGAAGIAPDARRIVRTVDMRYARQNYDISQRKR